MISDAQSKQLVRWSVSPADPKLTALEKGMLTWAVIDAKDKVLDVTCHSGVMLDFLQRKFDCEICGTAEQMEQVKNARLRLKNADIVYGLVEDVPWRDNAFDIVFFDLSGRDLDKTSRAFGEIGRVLKPGGQLVIGSPRLPALMQKAKYLLVAEDQDAIISPTKKEILSALLNAGYVQASWHQINLFNGTATCWKPMNPLE